MVQDCPTLIEKKDRATLNYIEEVLPSSNLVSSSDFGEVVPLKAITRAQAQAKNNARKEDETEQTPSEKSKKTKESWKARRARRAASKKRKEQLKGVENKKNKGEDLEDIDK